MPNHNHTLRGSEEDDDSTVPGGNALGGLSTIYATPANLGAMASNSLQNAGGSQPHNNMQPFLAINFIIALVGLYPSRS
jgi:microcystin-dependent protein